jgi:hypothetical protein
MELTTDPYDYSTQTLLRAKASECVELRDLLVAVAGDLERLACEHPDLASRFLARAECVAAGTAEGHSVIRCRRGKEV